MTARRETLTRPFAADHQASVARSMAKGAKPKGLAAYIAWFADRWNAEMPDSMHGLGGFVGVPDRPDRPSTLWARDSTPEQLTGGSHLGSPSLRDPFRRLMENSPYEVELAEYEGHKQLDPHYVRPLHAAIARLAHKKPFLARRMAQLAACGFDWQGVAQREGWATKVELDGGKVRWDYDEAEVYFEAALYLVWKAFDEQPREKGWVA